MKFRHNDGAEIVLTGSWEPVLEEPVERWVDVTKECEIRPTEIVHELKDFNRVVLGTQCCLYEGYRLRKVEVWQTSGVDGKNCRMCAFIVEKLEP